MNVYVESDFVLTLALQQGDYESAEHILRLARDRSIALKMPAFSLSEPFVTIQYRGNNRNRLLEEIKREARELGRTRVYRHMAMGLLQYVVDMEDVRRTQMNAVEGVVRDLGSTCELIQLNAEVLARASPYRVLHRLRPQDAIVLSSIIRDLERSRDQGESLFISQNRNDFEKPSIEDELGNLGCKYLADFANAVRYIERPAQPPNPT